jgi:thiamine monophosphate kinase
METRTYDFQVRILLTRDDDKYVAHALEMDLVAYGDTEEEAVEEVASLMKNQISFAIQRGEQHLICFKAPPEFFKEWEKVHASSLQGIVTGKKSGHIKIQAKTLVFGAEDIEALRKRLQAREAFELTPACA